MGNQRIKNKKFTFDEYSLAAISGTLTVLDLPQTNIVNCKQLYFLENVTDLNLSNNQIVNFEEEVAPILMTLMRLVNLKLEGNPVVKQTHKYRDQVVSLTQETFKDLDGKEIKKNER